MRAACGMAIAGPVRARMLVGMTYETWRRAGCTGSFDEKTQSRMLYRFHLHGALARARGTHLFDDICAHRITSV